MSIYYFSSTVFFKYAVCDFYLSLKTLNIGQNNYIYSVIYL